MMSRTASPIPSPIWRARQQLGFAASECLVFEDAPSGIRSAMAAGATVIAVPTTYTPEELSASEFDNPVAGGGSNAQS